MRLLGPVAILCGLTAWYIVAGKIGLQLALYHPSATVVWPPTAISLAALLLLGYWTWPAVFIGAFLVNLTTAGTLLTSLGIATGNTLEAVIGTWLVQRWAGGRDVFNAQSTTLRFVVLTALLSTTVSATVGVTTLWLGGYAQREQIDTMWVTWWLGDAVAAFILTPALVLWALDRRLPDDPRRRWETALCWGTVGFLTLLVFLSGEARTVRTYPLASLAFSVLIWIAVRLGTREAATATVLCAGIAIAGTLRGSGPFGAGPPHEALLGLQAFMAVIAVTALGLATGVGERRRAEAALKELNHTLERRIQERTSTLQASVEQLKELDRLKTAFVSILSHELRTPLTGIKGLTDNLIDGVAGELTGRHRHYVTRIQANADRLARMLNELMDLSKIETGAASITPTMVSLSEVLTDVVETFEPLARQKGVAIGMAPADGLPYVRADRDKLYEVVANLLENAVKFTPAEGRVDIATSVLDQRYVKVEIRDTGCGIPPEHVSKVFDKFYQVPSGSTTPGGAGLGLAIAKGLVELHGGHITVESGPGRGTSFWFTVPYDPKAVPTFH